MRTLRDHIEADAGDYALAASVASRPGDKDVWKQVSDRLKASLRDTKDLDVARDVVIAAAQEHYDDECSTETYDKLGRALEVLASLTGVKRPL